MKSNPAAENLLIAFFSTLLAEDTGSSVIFSVLSLAISHIQGLKSLLLLTERKYTKKPKNNNKK